MLDIIVKGKKIYVCFASGKIKIVKVGEDGEALLLLESMPIPGVTKENRLKEGYFVEVGEEILFVN